MRLFVYLLRYTVWTAMIRIITSFLSCVQIQFASFTFWEVCVFCYYYVHYRHRYSIFISFQSKKKQTNSHHSVFCSIKKMKQSWETYCQINVTWTIIFLNGKLFYLSIYARIFSKWPLLHIFKFKKKDDTKVEFYLQQIIR